MSGREKVILVGVAVALVYAGVTYAPGLLAVSGWQGAGDVPGAEAAAFAAGLRERLRPNYRVTPAERYLLQTAASPWTRDPMMPVAEAVAATTVQEDRHRTFRYTGYISAQGRALAILNGIEHEVGAEVTTGDYTVESISPERVVLVRKRDGERLTVSADESMLK